MSIRAFLSILAVALVLVSCSEQRESQPGSDSSMAGTAAPQAVSDPKPAGAELLKRGPAPQEWVYEEPPVGVREVRYSSAVGPLMAWYSIPAVTVGEGLPAVVYLHGGFAFSGGDFDTVTPFLDAGYAVMAPTFRGENGNPGSFELFWGEVDDVVSAVQWVAAQPEIDPLRVFVFGHSTGAALASLVSLREVSGIKASGAAAGLYQDDVFDDWAELVPFDLDSSEQRQRRLLLPQLGDLRVPLTLYLDTVEFLPETVAQLEALAAHDQVPLSAVLIEGDHFSILSSAIDSFIAQHSK